MFDNALVARLSICRAVRPTILLLPVAVSFRLDRAAPFSEPSHLRAKRQRRLPFEFTPQGLSVKSGRVFVARRLKDRQLFRVLMFVL